MKNFTIIGGGACGSATFIELIIEICSLGLQEELSITLIERRKKFGYGLAFGSRQKSHLLNTQAELMGIYANEPGHFAEWIKEKDGNKDEVKVEGSLSSAYTSRIFYGNYVSEQLENYIQKAKEHNVKIKLINDEAVDIDREKNKKFSITLESSETITADYILLAPGTPKTNKFKEFRAFRSYIDFPWPSNRIKNRINKDEAVGIPGSSLSAVDTVMTLMDNGHTGEIKMFSPFGMLPRVQPSENNSFKRKYLTIDNIHKMTRTKMRHPRVKDLFRLYIKDVEAAEGKKLDWKKLDRSARPVKDFLEYDIAAAEGGGDHLLNATYSLRYDASHIWGWMSLHQKKLFKKWLGSHWSANRHAMPLHNAKKLLSLLESGQLKVIPKNTNIEFSQEEQEFKIETVGDGMHYVKKLINATGTSSSLKGMDSDLIHTLLEKDYLQAYPAGGAVINPRSMQVISKKSGGNIYAVGHLANGLLLDVDAMWFNVRTISRLVSEIIFKVEQDGDFS
ncbi:FAD/NAD(P)-binding protein [Autumnicola psychrophila]|uniref:FAD/NAD(P)-binding protein n=1 Tax=Autumnicola psychrophila TaxID=3075592 RepID=A0ABU3DRJ0_9FLAO|nr:FAD/NAD(P)-binding protein [Zunongwangia sp. F225]MDT0686341.1 FAD/NAD(P)-binding protein [Zunongwangia sp. F225]